MNKLDFLRIFIGMGISCIPLHHRSKEPVLASWRQYQNVQPTHTEYRAWFPTDWNNYGVIAGWNNLVILDFDNLFYFSLWAEWMRAQGQECIAETCFKVITNAGMHVYLRTVQPSANSKRISASGGIDVQAQGKYVVGPGCVHPSGHIYQPIGAFEFPLVSDIESVLPLDLFPRVAHEQTVYTGAPVHIDGILSINADPMAFASMDLISRVKASVRIETLFAGVQRSSTDGRWLKALCPFHKDNHQSAWIDTVRQLAGCQVCGMKPMDAINLFARMKGLSNSAAVTALAKECGVWR